MTLRSGILGMVWQESKHRYLTKGNTKGAMPQTYQIEPPAADHSVLKTLLAYHTYLRGGGYSKYTPDDFTSDVKKFGLFVKDKKNSKTLN